MSDFILIQISLIYGFQKISYLFVTSVSEKYLAIPLTLVQATCCRQKR